MTKDSKALYISDFPDLKLLKRGKVRDIYDLGDSLLLVATDRISAFDVIMDDPIPGKGKILTRISCYWFSCMSSIAGNHLITVDTGQFPDECRKYESDLANRSMLVKKAKPLPVECIVRGYLSGSGWKSYLRSGTICGIKLPPGLLESDRLPEPVFTPTTKAEVGEHDENITFDQVVELVGQETADRIRSLSLDIYTRAAKIAEDKGIIIADTKFEFGYDENGELILIDELLTPDSSRFWPKETYLPGGPQPSFDKQYLRDYLESLDWDKTPPPPPLPAEVIENTRRKYLEALQILTGDTEL